jgi:hypothetical protein
MKSQNRISQLTLELYHRGLATNKERRLVEKALVTDSGVRKRYEELQESEREIRLLVTQELKRLNISEISVSAPVRKKTAAGFILAAAILLCAIIPAILFLKNSDSNKNNAVAEETVHEKNAEEISGTEIAEPPESSIEPPDRMERSFSGGRTEVAENSRNAPELQIEPESAAGAESPASPIHSSSQGNGVSIAAVPPPDTGVQTRGGSTAGNQDVAANVPEEPSNINIPAGITLIFDNMFANRNLTFVIIPRRITSIGRNAFGGNPLLSVTIGANVSIEDNAIPGNFSAVYNSGGKAAGTYTRPDVNSEAWEKK